MASRARARDSRDVVRVPHRHAAIFPRILTADPEPPRRRNTQITDRVDFTERSPAASDGARLATDSCLTRIRR